MVKISPYICPKCGSALVSEGVTQGGRKSVTCHRCRYSGKPVMFKMGGPPRPFDSRFAKSDDTLLGGGARQKSNHISDE